MFTCLEALSNPFFFFLFFFFLFLAWSAAESSGEEVFVETLSGDGGVELGTQFEVFPGFQGRWSVFSIAAEVVAPNFFLLTILETESLSAKGCKEGSVNLQNGVISTPEVRSSTIPLQVEKNTSGAPFATLTTLFSICAGRCDSILRGWR